MPRKRYSVEQIINHLREADVWLAQGRPVGEVRRHIDVTEQSYYRRCRAYDLQGFPGVAIERVELQRAGESQRILGEAGHPTSEGAGWEVVHVAVDDHSHLALT